MDTRPPLSAVDADDEIVGEVEVILSQDLANSLYVVQYPLRPPWRPYDPTNLKYAANMKYYYKY